MYLQESRRKVHGELPERTNAKCNRPIAPRIQPRRESRGSKLRGHIQNVQIRQRQRVPQVSHRGQKSRRGNTHHFIRRLFHLAQDSQNDVQNAGLARRQLERRVQGEEAAQLAAGPRRVLPARASQRGLQVQGLPQVQASASTLAEDRAHPHGRQKGKDIGDRARQTHLAEFVVGFDQRGYQSVQQEA